MQATSVKEQSNEQNDEQSTPKTPTTPTTPNAEQNSAKTCQNPSPNSPNDEQNTQTIQAILDQQTTRDTNTYQKIQSRTQKQNAHNNHMRVIFKDIMSWIRGRVLATYTAATLIIINIVNWIFTTISHLYANGTDTTLSKLFVYRKPKITNALFFGHNNIPVFLSQLLKTLVYVNSISSLMINAALSIILIGLAETHMKKIRMISISLISTCSGIIFGLTLIGALSTLISNLGWIRRIPIRLSPFTLFVGIFMAAAYYQSLLLRRRMLVVGYTITFAMLLYSGNPGDYCTLIAAITGQIIGKLLLRSHRDKSSQTKKQRQWWQGTDYEVRRLFAISQVVMAIGPILALSSRSHAGILTMLGLFMSPELGGKSWLTRCMSNSTSASCLLHVGLHHTAYGGLWIRAALPMVAMLLIAWGLLRGRRLAAWTAIAVNTITAIFATTYFTILPLIASMQNTPNTGHNASAVAFALTAFPPIIIVILLVSNIKHFSIHTDKRQVTIGLTIIFLTLLFTSIAYISIGLLLPQKFHPTANLYNLILDLPGRWMPMGFASRTRIMLIPKSTLISLVMQSIGVIFWAAVVFVCVKWFRTIISINEEDRNKASKLVECGGETMSFMTTWQGNHYWFSPSENSAIAYRVKYGIALTLTGPFGEQSEYRQSIKGFIQFCEKNSLAPVFYAVHENQRKILEELGFSSIKVGTEMIINPNSWQTRGKKWQDIRTAINKAKREGITDIMSTFDEAQDDIKRQIVEISEEWAELKALPEMKFTLGGIEELQDSRVILLYAIDLHNRVLGITSWMPSYQHNKIIGWTLDFMRHRTDSPNGIMEFLIARMAERLRDEGLEHTESAVKFMSLSAAPLAGMEDIEDKDIDKDKDIQENSNESNIINHALTMVSDILEPAYGFKSLYFFKKKFQPDANPVYICYQDSAKLAQISLAVTSSYLPETNPKQLLEMIKTLQNGHKKD